MPESSTEKNLAQSYLTPKDVQTLQELKEEIESNAPSDSNSLDLNKAKDLAEKAQQQNWLKRENKNFSRDLKPTSLCEKVKN